jgi:hypothetical protein
MHIAEILTLRDYYRDFRFRGRIDNLPNYARSTNRWVLIAKEFFYFGANAKGIQSIPSQNLAHPFEKMGPGFRSDFTQAFIRDFESWLYAQSPVGIQGSPCGGHPSRALLPHTSRPSCNGKSAKGSCNNWHQCGSARPDSSGSSRGIPPNGKRSVD